MTHVSWLKKQVVKLAKRLLIYILKDVENNDLLTEHGVILRTQSKHYCTITPWGANAKVIVIRIPNRK